MRVPPELDSLMWAIAEENSPNAADEFVRRYPGFRDEFLRRKDAVSRLKSSKPAPSQSAFGETIKPIPRFTPRAPRRAVSDPRRFAIASALALAAIAAAAYTVTTVLAPRHDPVPPPPRTLVRTAPSDDPSKLNSPVSPPRDEPVPPPAVQEPPPRRVIPSLTELPQTLMAHGTTLQRALRTLEAQSGLTFVLAPGMPDPDVDVQYDRISVMAILRDLGHQYRFTAFDQGDGSVLIIPAVDLKDTPAGGTGAIHRLGG